MIRNENESEEGESSKVLDPRLLEQISEVSESIISSINANE